ncbi:MAG: DUF4124 domain-containing protein [Lautropia sp.]
MNTIARPTGILMLLGALAAGAPAHADVYKCQDANGRTHYADRPCSTGTAQHYAPPALTTIESARLTGGRKPPGKETGKGKWVSPLDPVAACHARGGEIDKEMRGCRLP